MKNQPIRRQKHTLKSAKPMKLYSFMREMFIATFCRCSDNPNNPQDLPYFPQ